jgi:hypothetical protein
MDERDVILGEIILDRESIVLHAEMVGPMIPARIALLKYKLAFILDTRFKPAPPPESQEMTVEELTARWKCPTTIILRRIQAGELHPIERGGEMRFDRDEVERLSAPV